MVDNLYSPPQSPPQSRRQAKGRRKATISLGLGLISIVTWVIPLFGLPTTIAGLVLGIQGLGRQRRGKAVAGIVLSIIFLILTILNAIYGAYLAATGKHSLLKPAPSATSKER